jgi:hypothetical protein
MGHECALGLPIAVLRLMSGGIRVSSGKTESETQQNSARNIIIMKLKSI